MRHSRHARRHLGDLERAGFTLVELMVVMAIIAMAASMITPTIAAYFRNRAVDSIRGELTSALQRARYKAVSESRNISVVFFKEGVRIYDERNRIFTEEDWRPSDSALGDAKANTFYVLGCAGGMRSDDKGFADIAYNPSRRPYIPPYYWWLERQKATVPTAEFEAGKRDTSDLVKVTFQRDGTLIYGAGAADVRSLEFRKDPPANADIIVRQIGNRAACYVDMTLTGSTKSRLVVSPDPYFDAPEDDA